MPSVYGASCACSGLLLARGGHLRRWGEPVRTLGGQETRSAPRLRCRSWPSFTGLPLRNVGPAPKAAVPTTHSGERYAPPGGVSGLSLITSRFPRPGTKLASMRMPSGSTPPTSRFASPSTTDAARIHSRALLPSALVLMYTPPRLPNIFSFSSRLSKRPISTETHSGRNSASSLRAADNVARRCLILLGQEGARSGLDF